MIGSGEGIDMGGGAQGGGGLLKKGPWTAAEDEVLIQYVRAHGEGNWNAVQKHSGLNRCGKSCRLRWANHLRPNLKKGSFNPEEERLILELHSKYGNKWARMATQLPGRTDNEIKNYWNTRVKRRKRQGLPLYPNDMNQQQHHSQLPSPTTTITPTSLTPTPTSTPTTATPTPPTTPTTNFPFQYHSPASASASAYDPAPAFSFQYRPVPLLAAPMGGRAGMKPYPAPQPMPIPIPMPMSFVQFSGAYEGGPSAASAVKAEQLPSNQFHHNNTAAPHEIPRIHHHGGLLLDDILENLLDDNSHTSIDTSSELVPKEEAKEHMNNLPEDLSKFLNFAPSSAVHVGPPHWYSHGGGDIPSIQSDDTTIGGGGDMQQLASFFPVSASEAAAETPATNYAQNPATWDILPGIGKGWFKNT